MKTTVIISLMFIFIIFLQNISSQNTFHLWSAGNVPGATGNSEDDIPILKVYLPDPSISNNSAILMVPGGAYGTIVDAEANAAIDFWQPKGFVVATLKYRVAPYKYPIPMLDVKRAMRLLRSFSSEMNFNKDLIGVLGCSAGGHLSSYLATNYDMGNPQAPDSVERYSCKPDFNIFVYPVITMDEEFTHSDTRRNMIGDNPSPNLVDSLSNEKNVTENTSPTYLVHGTVDNVVPYRNSQEFYDSCIAHHVDAKFHLITSDCGWHGFHYDCENWGEECLNWLKSSGCLDPPTSNLVFKESEINSFDVENYFSIIDLKGNVLRRNLIRSEIKNISNGTYLIVRRNRFKNSTVRKIVNYRN